MSLPLQAQKPTKSLSEIAADFAHDILPGELQDICEAVRTLKRGSGWGKVNMTYLNSDVDSIEITITRKPKRQKSV